ncbi:hypothetical protein H8A99_16835 [Bradyrhizobium sp. Arg68]|uniref:hypothetical protein n=1 Tax=Bradyrhizobium ivorense TaxID=2511166 RepID=UPI001E416AD2|nr:hypothetical protein [Bradyrhizobium ivorense]MCC8938093.1 hypothetical protein [Bradyrhizobium ivorense]
MTSQPANPENAKRSRLKESQEEVARSLERELRLMAEDRQDRASRLGFDIGAKRLTDGDA